MRPSKTYSQSPAKNRERTPPRAKSVMRTLSPFGDYSHPRRGNPRQQIWDRNAVSSRRHLASAISRAHATEKPSIYQLIFGKPVRVKVDSVRNVLAEQISDEL